MNPQVEEFHMAVLHVLADRGYAFDECFVDSMETMSLAQLTEVLEMCFSTEAYQILEKATILIR